MNQQAGYKAVLVEIEQTIEQAIGVPSLSEYADHLGSALVTLNQTTTHLLKSMATQNIDLVLANSVQYLSMFGHVVIGWLWLKQATLASKALDGDLHDDEKAFYRGKIQTMQYFYRYELPEINLWANTLKALDDTTYEMKAEWF